MGQRGLGDSNPHQIFIFFQSMFKVPPGNFEIATYSDSLTCVSMLFV